MLNWKKRFTGLTYSGEDAIDSKMDRPMILKGMRVALGEIEAILNQQPYIARSYVRVLEADSGSPRLVAYVIPDGRDQSARRMQVRMKRILPLHLLPEQFVLVDEIPFTPDGKVDESRLPVPEQRAYADAVFQSRGERFLIRLWKDLLEREDISVEDDFFAIGGTDALAERMIAQIESRTSVFITLEQLRNNSSLQALAAILDRSRSNDPNKPVIELRPGEERPIFLIPAAARTSLSAMSYVSRIDEGVRVIGLEYPRDLPPVTAPNRVPALAKYFVQQIRTVQPSGPYSLIGNCMGGVLVYEVMRQLAQAGQKIDRVVVIDCAAPRLKNTVLNRGLADYWRRFLHLLQSGKIFKALQARITRRIIKPVQRQVNLDQDLRRAIKYLWDAKTSYRVSSRYNDSMLVILNSLSRETERSSRWSDVAPRAKLHFVEETDHIDLFQSDDALNQIGGLVNTYLKDKSKS